METATPLEASLEAGEPVEVDHVASFVDGIGAPAVFPEMFALARDLLDGSIAVSLAAVADAIRLLFERARIVAEGAGAASLAALLSGRAEGRKLVCVVSGGNIDTTTLGTIMAGKMP